MAKIYTKTGDNGETSLVGGTRIPKDSELLDAYGIADELNAFIGTIIAELNNPYLTEIQKTLFIIGGILATEPENYNKYWGNCNLKSKICEIEQEIDRMCTEIPPFSGFTLPQGSLLIAHIHICRTICRKLERKMIPIFRQNKNLQESIQYVNRLSDYFYILANFTHSKEKIPLTYWKQE